MKGKYMKEWENNPKIDGLVEAVKKIQVIYLEASNRGKLAHRLKELVKTYENPELLDNSK